MKSSAAVTPVTEGYYLLNPGDTAQKVARRLYGDVHKSNVLLQANPEDWNYLERIVVPNKKGRITTLLSSQEKPASVIKRMFPNQPVHLYTTSFLIWNGGERNFLREGELVFVPER